VTRPRSAQGMRTAAILIAVIAILYLAREILTPLAFAVTLALVLSPAVGWLQKLHIRRFAAVLAIMMVLVSGAAVVGYVIFNQLIEVVSDLPAYRENIDNKVHWGGRLKASRKLGRNSPRPRTCPRRRPLRAERDGAPRPRGHSRFK
jgi:predicted PurR-regulated permease PerM